jgi:hypothetical protein
VLGACGCVGDPGGTVGWVSGVLLGGISGALGARDGDVGGGLFCAQPTVIAARAIAASVNLGAFIILHSSLLCRLKTADQSAESALTPASEAID